MCFKFLKKKKQKIKCITSIGGWDITVDKQYEVLDVKENPDSTKSYKIIDDFGKEKFINEFFFVKCDQE